MYPAIHIQIALDLKWLALGYECSWSGVIKLFHLRGEEVLEGHIYTMKPSSFFVKLASKKVGGYQTRPFFWGKRIQLQQHTQLRRVWGLKNLKQLAHQPVCW